MKNIEFVLCYDSQKKSNETLDEWKNAMVSLPAKFDGFYHTADERFTGAFFNLTKSEFKAFMKNQKELKIGQITTDGTRFLEGTVYI